MTKDNDCCKEFSVNEAAIAQAQEDLPDAKTMTQLSLMFSAFADASRLKIMLSICERELCVCELSEVLEMSMPAVSHHLRRLKDLGLVRNRRDGKLVYYSLDDEHVRQLLTIGLEHILH